MNAIVNHTHQEIWELAVSEIRNQLPQSTFNNWLRDAALSHVDGSTYHITVRDDRAKEIISHQLRPVIARTLSFVAGQEIALEVRTPEDIVAVAIPDPSPTAVPPPPKPPEDPPTRLAGPDGYGGNLSEEERGQLLQRIQAREQGKGKANPNARVPAHLNGHPPKKPKLASVKDQAHKRGPKYAVPRPPRGRGDDATQIDVVERDPMKAHVETAHYAKRFWQPLLGVNAFALWELLRSYYYFVRYHNADQPTIKLLCESLGWKDRRTLLGRPAKNGRNGQKGAVQVLAEFGILIHETTGEGKHVTHHFRRVLDDLPLLTPAQVAQLSAHKQIEHETFLSYYDFDMDAWLENDAETNVSEAAAKRIL